MPIDIIEGDSREVLTEFADNSIDSCVTDPPYALTANKKGGTGPASVNLNTPAGRARITVGFMGKAWDNGDTAFDPAFWVEVLRVLKPGAHLLAFGGTRTYHRLVCAIEDAGFEIRDQIGWAYGSGFPKSHDVAKSIDKAARGVPHGGADPTSPNHGKFKGGCSDENAGGQGFGAGPGQFMAEAGIKVVREYVDNAAQWQGWGTALKPAWEPICLARKPLAGTVAENVLEHGTGALNIDGCRVGWPGDKVPEIGTPAWGGPNKKSTAVPGQDGDTVERVGPSELGRWPANIIHDGSDEVLAAFPDTRSGAMKREVPGYDGDSVTGFIRGRSGPSNQHGDSGSAARFFYCAKASKKDRGEGNSHPTVKPTELMRYLCRLVTPPGGTVLDPFMGSGSTGVAAQDEGFSFTGIEADASYFDIACKRLGLDDAMQAAE